MLNTLITKTLVLRCQHEFVWSTLLIARSMHAKMECNILAAAAAAPAIITTKIGNFICLSTLRYAHKRSPIK